MLTVVSRGSFFKGLDNKIIGFLHTRRSQSMHAKEYGSVLFSAPKPHLVMGFCRKEI